MADRHSAVDVATRLRCWAGSAQLLDSTACVAFCTARGPHPQVFDGPPATVAELAAVEEDLTAGAMQADVVATNQRPLELQLLQASLPACGLACQPAGQPGSQRDALLVVVATAPVRGRAVQPAVHLVSTLQPQAK